MKKKILGTILTFAMLLVVVGCSGGKEGTRTFVSEESGLETTEVYTYKGDEVLKSVSTIKMPYSLAGVKDKNQAQELLGGTLDVFSSFNSVEGFNSEVKYENDHALQTIEIDYSVINFEQLKSILGQNILAGDSKDAKYVSMEKTAKGLIAEGYEEVEK